MAKAKGNGTIIEKKRGVFEVQLSLGRNQSTGKYERISRTVHGTKADAQKLLRKLIKENEEGIDLKRAAVTFREFSEQWHEARVSAGTLAPSSVKREEGVLKVLCEHIGHEKLEALTPARIEGLYNQLRKEGNRGNGNPLSETTMVKYHETLSKVLKKAVDYDIIAKNPCDRVTRPKVAAAERKALTKSKGAELLERVREAENAAAAELETELCAKGKGPLKFKGGISALGNAVAVHVGLATGARRGEVFGLSWRDLEMVQTKGGIFCTVKIRHTLDSLGNIKEPKTKAGNRDVAIDQETAESLSRLRRMQAEYLKRLGIKQTPQTPVFCSNVGRIADLHNFERWWRSWRDANGFPGMKFHELRHTQATQLLANGVDVKTVQSRLGHSNAAITLNWYAHALPENDKRAADLIGALFSQGGNKEVIPMKSAI